MRGSRSTPVIPSGCRPALRPGKSGVGHSRDGQMDVAVEELFSCADGFQVCAPRPRAGCLRNKSRTFADRTQLIGWTMVTNERGADVGDSDIDRFTVSINAILAQVWQVEHRFCTLVNGLA